MRPSNKIQKKSEDFPDLSKEILETGYSAVSSASTFIEVESLFGKEKEFATSKTEYAKEYVQDKLNLFCNRILKNRWGNIYVYHENDLAFASILLKRLKDAGYIRGILPHKNFNDEPKLHSLSIDVDTSKVTTDGEYPFGEVYSGGKSIESLQDALSKALGEYLERYPLFLYEDSSLEKRNFNYYMERKIAAIDPSSLNGSTDSLKPEDWKNEDFLWVRGTTLVGKKEIMIPAQLVFLNYNSKHNGWDEKKMRESNTNGAAAGESLEAATTNAMYEIVERDSLLVYWLNSIAPPVISNDSIGDFRLRQLLNVCRKYYLNPIFLNTTSDLGIPSCVCVLEDQSSSNVGPVLTVGSKSGRSWNHLLRDALTEAISARLRLRYLYENGDIGTGYTNVNEDTDLFVALNRITFWANRKNRKAFNFFLSGTKQDFGDLHNLPLFKTPSEELGYIVDQIESKSGHQIIYYNVKNPVLTFAGMSTVKVLIPSLQPFTVNSKPDYQFDRLEKFARYANTKPSRNSLPCPLS